MKALFLLAAFACSINLATAGNEGPNASPDFPNQGPKTVLASVSAGSGFSPVPASSGIEVLNNGEVIKFYRPASGQTKERRVTRLSKSALAKLKAQIAKVTASELIDLNSNEPFCEDGPVTSYVVMQAGDPIEVSQESACHTYAMANGQDRDIRSTLDALMARAR